MVNHMQKKPVIKYQGILGLIVLVGVGLLAMNHLDGLVLEERPVRAQAEARELASAVLDFHTDTGKWPRSPDREIDLTLLLDNRSSPRVAALAGASGGELGGLGVTGALNEQAGAGPSWLKEIPLDPWGRPYLVMATDTAIAVLSTGPDGTLNTNVARLWTRPGNINPGDGDDVGVVLEIDPDGGS